MNKKIFLIYFDSAVCEFYLRIKFRLEL